MVNIDVVKQVNDIINTKPESFNMDTWAHAHIDVNDGGEEFINECGTTACIAGHAALISGSARLIVIRSEEDPSKIDDAYYHTDNGWIRDGINALGITDELAGRLFYLRNGRAKEAMGILAETGSERAAMKYILDTDAANCECGDCESMDENLLNSLPDN